MNSGPPRSPVHEADYIPKCRRASIIHLFYETFNSSCVVFNMIVTNPRAENKLSPCQRSEYGSLLKSGTKKFHPPVY